MKIFKTQQGIIQIPLIIFLLVGIIVGVILVQRQTNILSKAKEWSCQQPLRGWCSPKGTPKPTCTSRPSCLDSTPRCLIAEPAEGWCPSKEQPPTTNLCPPPETEPFGSCGGDKYKGINFVCPDGTKGRIGGDKNSWGSRWGFGSPCRVLGDLKQEVIKRCEGHFTCPAPTPLPSVTSIPLPTGTPNPAPTPNYSSVPNPYPIQSCDDCPNGSSLCYFKDQESYPDVKVCVNPKTDQDTSDKICKVCPPKPEVSSSPISGGAGSGSSFGTTTVR